MKKIMKRNVLILVLAMLGSVFLCSISFAETYVCGCRNIDACSNGDDFYGIVSVEEGPYYLEDCDDICESRGYDDEGFGVQYTFPQKGPNAYEKVLELLCSYSSCRYEGHGCCTNAPCR